MTPSARIAAICELLEGYLPILMAEQHGPALDVFLQRAFRQRRYAGSTDRAVIGEGLYRVVRNLAELRWRIESAGQTIDARHLVLLQLALDGRLDEIGTGGGAYDAAPVTDGERQWLDPACSLSRPDGPVWARWNVPEWTVASIEARFAAGDEAEAELAALNARAPTDVRINPLKTGRQALLKELAEAGFDAAPTPRSPLGLRLDHAAGLSRHPALQEGRAVVQDEGSQLAAILCDVQPGQQVADMCAGAGGKGLLFAAQMNNTGQLYAFDVDKKRIATLKERARQAGVRNIQPKAISSRFGERRNRLLRPRAGQMDRVIVDAPCSGSGTWRRNPELKWRMTAEAVDALSLEQADLLEEAAGLVAPGGRLVYITCSILPEENESQVEGFLAMNSDWSLIPWDKILTGKGIGPLAGNHSRIDGCLQLTPARHGTDGFFIAVFGRPS